MPQQLPQQITNLPLPTLPAYQNTMINQLVCSQNFTGTQQFTILAANFNANNVCGALEAARSQHVSTIASTTEPTLNRMHSGYSGCVPPFYIPVPQEEVTTSQREDIEAFLILCLSQTRSSKRVIQMIPSQAKSS